MFLIFGIGFISLIFNKYTVSNILKDITYFLKPIIALLASYFLVRKINDFEFFLKNVLYLGVFTAFIHLTGVFVVGDFINNSINSIRGDFGFDNFIEIFSLYILIFYKKILKVNLIENRTYRNTIIFILLSSIILYFSRTMLVTFALVGFSMFGYAKITKNTMKIIGVMIILFGLFFAYLHTMKIDRNSPGLEGFLYKIKISPEEIFKTKINRDDHKDLWDHWRGYEAKRALALLNEKPVSYLTGTGFGSMVNLKFKAPLGENGMKYISRLHNGYVFTFYKTGFFGLLLLLIFLVNLYIKVYVSNFQAPKIVFTKKFISSIGLFYIFSTLIITGIFIPADAIIFILGGFLFFNENKIT